MATRAERFKATVQRSGPKKSPSTLKRKPPKQSALAKEEVDEGEISSNKPPVGKRRVATSPHSAERNVSKRASKKAGVALEDSVGKPPRKMTRSGANRAKPDSQLKQRSTRETTSAPARAARAKARAKKVR